MRFNLTKFGSQLVSFRDDRRGAVYLWAACGVFGIFGILGVTTRLFARDPRRKLALSTMIRGFVREINLRAVANGLQFAAIRWRGHIHFVGRGPMYLLSNDNRAKMLLRQCGASQPRVTWLWRKLVRTFKPDLVLDIGANYGEITLSSRYPAETRVALFEANPNLANVLQQSVARHSDGECMAVHKLYLGNCTGTVEFKIDKKWSGTSSAVLPIADAPWKGAGVQTVETISVPSRALDDLYSYEGVERALVKIDVEGAEEMVLAGAERLLSTCTDCVIVIEYSSRSVAFIESEWGVSLGERLAKYGKLFHITDAKTLVPLDNTEALEGKQDIVVAKGKTAVRMLESLRLPWILYA